MKDVYSSSLSKAREHILNHDTGLITACRYARDCGKGEKYTKAENKKRNRSLLAKLLSKGYGITTVQGAYIENYGSPDAKTVSEKVYFVVDLKDSGKLENDLKRLGKEFEQDSILFLSKGGESGHLIGTNKCPNAFPGYGKKVSLNHPLFGKDGEFHTRIKNRPFVLSAKAKDVASPQGYFGRFGCAMTALLHWSEL